MHKSIIDKTQLHIDKGICDTQGKIFEYACRIGYDLKLFSDYFLNSSFCNKSFDAKIPRYIFEDEETCMEILFWKKPDSEKETLKSNIYSNPDIGYWFGYTYRQFAIVSGLSSAELNKRLDFDKLLVNYEAHHTIDEWNSIQMLCKFYKINMLPEYVNYIEFLNQ